MSEKLCVFCLHLRMDVSDCHGDYPDPARFVCLRRHWSLNVDDYGPIGTEEFREAILTAETCPDYEQVEP